MNYHDEFLNLADRFRNVVASDDKMGEAQLKKRTARAARLVKFSIDTGCPAIEMPEGQWWPTPDPLEDSDTLWSLAWMTVCRVAEPTSPVGMLLDSEKRSPGVAVRTYKPDHWREAAKDYAEICVRLAGPGEKVKQTKPPAKRGRPADPKVQKRNNAIESDMADGMDNDAIMAKYIGDYPDLSAETIRQIRPSPIKEQARRRRKS